MTLPKKKNSYELSFTVIKVNVLCFGMYIGNRERFGDRKFETDRFCYIRRYQRA